MKKSFLLLAGSALIFASCGSNNNNDGQSKAQVDSTVNAQVAAKEAAMKAANDSTIAAQAKAKADSEMIAKDAISKDREHRGGTAHHEGKGSSPVTTPTVAPTPTNPKEDRFNSSNNTTPTQTQQQNTQKKADRFKQN